MRNYKMRYNSTNGFYYFFERVGFLRWENYFTTNCPISALEEEREKGIKTLGERLREMINND